MLHQKEESMLEECTRPQRGSRRRDVAIRLHEEDSAFRRGSQSCLEAYNHETAVKSAHTTVRFSALSVQRSSSKKKSTKQAKEPKPVSKPVNCECVSAQFLLFGKCLCMS